jgi:hypothetical protein
MKKARYFSLFLVLWFLPLFAHAAPLVDAVIMSYDRPLQCWATLESLEKYCTGINTTHLILRTSNDDYESGYDILLKRFPYVIVHHQSRTSPKEDFQPLFLDATFGKSSPAPYVIFLVDDIIVTDYIDLNECAQKKEQYKAWGFFLRLGKNIIYHYACNDRRSTPPPKGYAAEGRYFIWNLCNGKINWCMPNNVDITLYKKKEIELTLKHLIFSNPNLLAQRWERKITGKEIGISYEYSKAINIPLNRVGPLTNRIISGYSQKSLLEKFLQGFRLDISPFFQARNSSYHVEMHPQFIKYKSQ